MEKVVYCHRRNDNNQIFYIGIGNEYRPFVKQRRSLEWNEIVNNYGYTIEILHRNLSDKEAKYIEKTLISEIGRDNLVNKNIGGGGPIKHSDITKSKMSKVHKGRTFTKEWRVKLSISKMGNLNPMSGGHTNETKKKIGESCKGKVNTSEQRLKQSKAQMKSVAQYKDGILIDIYDSIKIASLIIGGSDSAISGVCKGNRKSHKGFQWEYIKH